jgi:DNA replication protein DnaC
VLIGENGSGKTHIARHVRAWASAVTLMLPPVDAAVGVKMPDVCMVSWPAVVDGFKQREFSVMEDLLDCSLCILDDIGAEHDPSGFGKEQLCLLLSRREFRWTLITTNIQPGAWPTVFERRIASRLVRGAEHVDLSKVPDYASE